ncbi:MAG: adenylosuccinate synthetase [Altibacter sp.]|uniref:adenylosuccinate synthetase n=1 Tax=Altibacter sp. TaxID=2024823 RepID=UPI001DB7623D|nr:adenylosuccinate synthetase [Altibacter sp.]MBZ0326269.1 adenylosuccinate synthetase [Altibacter sp.]
MIYIFHFSIGIVSLFLKFFVIQIPKEVPHPDNNSPLDLSNPADIIIYIVIPIIFVALYFLSRKRKKNNN